MNRRFINNKSQSIHLVWIVVLLWLGTCLAEGKQVKAIHKTTVYIFLSDTCPICQMSTLTLRNLYEQYNKHDIEFVGVFPEKSLRAADLILFQKQYQISFPLILDEYLVLTRRFHISTTPEVVVVNKNGLVQYKGRIDDSYLALGKRRVVTQHRELQDALQAITENKPIAIKHTEAVGCLISR